MSENIESLFADDPIKWVQGLPEYQRESIEILLSGGASFEQVAQTWLSASASNTAPFAASAPIGDKGAFLANLKREARQFLCGDEKYKTEREGLFSRTSPVRTYVVSAMSVAIAPHLGVAAVAIAPVIALVLASIGKVTLNAWCAMDAAV